MTPPHNNFGDSRPDPMHASPAPGIRYSVSELLEGMRDEMRHEFAALHKRLDAHDAFTNGQKGDGTDSAKVRLDRLEQAQREREIRANLAFGASMTALIGVAIAWIRSVSHGGTH